MVTSYYLLFFALGGCAGCPAYHLTKKRIDRGQIVNYRSFYFDVVNQCSDAIVVMRHDRVIFANKAAFRLAGLPQAKPKTVFNLARMIHPDDVARSRLRQSKVLSGEITDT